MELRLFLRKCDTELLIQLFFKVVEYTNIGQNSIGSLFHMLLSRDGKIDAMNQALLNST